MASSGALDIWLEGQVSYFNSKPSDARYQGHTHIAMAGVDYRIMPGLIVGAMAQMDRIKQSSDNSTDVTGRGWMAGPYVSAKLMPSLFFDARVLAGTSKNELNDTDDFKTKRVLTSAKLTGSFSSGAWQVKPSAELMYFADKQKEFTDSNGTVVESQTFKEGRLNFGPHISYTMVMPDKSVFQPFVEVTGIWAFHRTDALTSTNDEVSQKGARARVKGGFSYRSPDGIRVTGAASFEGGGSTDYRSVQGEARVAIPLQQ